MFYCYECDAQIEGPVWKSRCVSCVVKKLEANLNENEELRKHLAAAESELNRLRCAMNDEKVASGVLSAFWRRVYGAANFTAFDKQVLTAHMLTALSGIDIFSKRELAETVCPDCGPVSINPDVFNNGIPVSGICPYCKDRLHFAPQTMSGEV